MKLKSHNLFNFAKSSTNCFTLILLFSIKAQFSDVKRIHESGNSEGVLLFFWEQKKIIPLTNYSNPIFQYSD